MYTWMYIYIHCKCMPKLTQVWLCECRLLYRSRFIRNSSINKMIGQSEYYFWCLLLFQKWPLSLANFDLNTQSYQLIERQKRYLIHSFIQNGLFRSKLKWSIILVKLIKVEVSLKSKQALKWKKSIYLFSFFSFLFNKR